MSDDADRTGPPAVDREAVRARLLGDHDDTLRAVLAAADAVVDRAAGDPAPADDPGADAAAPTLPRSTVADGLERELDRRGLAGPSLAALEDAVDAAGRELRADPVPAPPYLTVTARGPVLRGTVADGRLVVTVAAFAPVGASGPDGDAAGADARPVGADDGPGRRPRYRRTATDPAAALEVRFRHSPTRR